MFHELIQLGYGEGCYRRKGARVSAFWGIYFHGELTSGRETTYRKGWECVSMVSLVAQL